LTTLVLVRHAENDWVKSGKLAGWTPEVHLNDEGKRQADLLGQRLATARLQEIYSSPLERATETATAIISHYPSKALHIEEALGEAHYGRWTGESLRKLARTRLWQVVQTHPSRAQFPGGEALLEMQARALSAIERIADAYPHGVVAVVSHGDVIKSIVAHYAGMHLDMFQRLMIAPASMSVVHLGRHGPVIMSMNDTQHYQTHNDKSEH
jgi:probable phosphomutase (TIGR03848 family)